MEIAVISGKGGTGKSSISAAFITIAQRAVAVDCDVDASNLYLLFSPTCNEEHKFVSGYQAEIDVTLCQGCALCAKFCRFEAISFFNSEIRISETDCDGCFLCSRICPSQAIRMIPADKSRLYIGDFRYGDMIYGYLAPGEENSGKLVSQIREKAQKKAYEKGHDIIIIDGPPGIGCPVLSTIVGVDRVVIVTEPSLSGFHDLQRTAFAVRQFDLPVFVIVNKFDLNPAIALQIDQWCEKEKIRIVARLPFEAQMVNAMVERKTIVEYQPNNEIVQLLKKAYYNIIKN